jgi:hypothetical protein
LTQIQTGAHTSGNPINKPKPKQPNFELEWAKLAYLPPGGEGASVPVS